MDEWGGAQMTRVAQSAESGKSSGEPGIIIGGLGGFGDPLNTAPAAAAALLMRCAAV